VIRVIRSLRMSVAVIVGFEGLAAADTSEAGAFYGQYVTLP
jgi:hypothetical protein